MRHQEGKPHFCMPPSSRWVLDIHLHKVEILSLDLNVWKFREPSKTFAKQYEICRNNAFFSPRSSGNFKALPISLSTFPGNLPAQPARANRLVNSEQLPRLSWTTAAAAACRWAALVAWLLVGYGLPMALHLQIKTPLL